MGAKNKVIAGDYKGKIITYSFGTLSLATSMFKFINLDKDNIVDYEVMNETHKKSAVSAVGRGLVGGFILGPVGMLAGLSAKSKGVHIVAVEFKDGKKSLLELDDKLYSALMKKCF